MKRSKMWQECGQDRISGNGAKWAGEGHADNGDNDVAKMHNEKRHKKGNALSERARTGHSLDAKEEEI